LSSAECESPTVKLVKGNVPLWYQRPTVDDMASTVTDPGYTELAAVFNAIIQVASEYFCFP
jgi:hypothetical protein